MNTTENNKIIAEFMGAKLTKDLQIVYPIYEGDSSYVKNLKYHSDWNWLMEVVEKIESLRNQIVIFNKTAALSNVKEPSVFNDSFKAETKKQAVYNACVEFIKWYNEQNSTKK